MSLKHLLIVAFHRLRSNQRALCLLLLATLKPLCTNDCRAREVNGVIGAIGAIEKTDGIETEIEVTVTETGDVQDRRITALEDQDVNTKEIPIPQVATTERENEKIDIQAIVEMSHVSGTETEEIDGEGMRMNAHPEENVIYSMTGEEAVEAAEIAARVFQTQTEVIGRVQVRPRRRRSLHRT